jgi:Family of unknown function (DUF5678)
MITVPIREDLYEPIQQLARQERVSIDTIVDKWLTRQLALEREQQIKEETNRFQEKHAELLNQYRGEFIAMQNGNVLDHGIDLRDLYLRVKRQYKNAPVLITQVTENPKPVYNMRSPRLARYQ